MTDQIKAFRTEANRLVNKINREVKDEKAKAEAIAKVEEAFKIVEEALTKKPVRPRKRPAKRK